MGRIRSTLLARHRLCLERLPTTPVDAAARTLVIAPHPDDETLGCGGTIALKRRAGAIVRIVYMTDGSRSHWPLIEPEALAEIREREAIAASSVLGVDENALVFLRLPETHVHEHRDEVRREVARILEREAPNEIYLPYRKDPHNDHIATASVVLEVLRAARRTIRLFEYPIWLWWTWPWAPATLGFDSWTRAFWKSTLHTRFGWQILREFTHAVDIASVIDVKRAALDKHESQMTRYRPDPSWTTLSDVGGGAFLENLLQPRELFRTSFVSFD